MNNILWELPMPSSGFGFINIGIISARNVAVTFEFEDDDGRIQIGKLIFKNVLRYKSSFLYATTTDMIKAYDKIIDMGTSSELVDVRNAMQIHGCREDVKHYRIFFDDGPCFDFIAAEFETILPNLSSSK